jgi:hypothetical protein
MGPRNTLDEASAAASQWTAWINFSRYSCGAAKPVPPSAGHPQSEVAMLAAGRAPGHLFRVKDSVS